MTTDAEIIRDYERREAEAGGAHAVNARAVCTKIAADLGVPFERVRQVMLDHWCMAGSG